ncbi:MAG: response regulator, partial [Alphaproteobacteria bacterium]
MQPYVLIVEDEPGIAELLDYNLQASGFDTSIATDGDEAELALAERLPDAVLLDWMLPGVSGIELCRRIRKRPASRSLPIILLTARGEEADRIRGLDSGADDYVTKPFSPTEVVARLKAVLRRSNPAVTEDKLVYEDLTMDLITHRVHRSGQKIHLGPTEFRLLQYFMQRPGRVFSREQ